MVIDNLVWSFLMQARNGFLNPTLAAAIFMTPWYSRKDNPIEKNKYYCGINLDEPLFYRLSDGSFITAW